MIHDQKNVLTDNELVTVKDFSTMKRHACLCIWNEHSSLDSLEIIALCIQIIAIDLLISVLYFSLIIRFVSSIAIIVDAASTSTAFNSIRLSCFIWFSILFSSKKSTYSYKVICTIWLSLQNLSLSFFMYVLHDFPIPLSSRIFHSCFRGNLILNR